MPTSSLSRNHFVATEDQVEADCPPNLSVDDIEIYVNGKRLNPSKWDFVPNTNRERVSFDPELDEGGIVDIVRTTDRLAVNTNPNLINTQMLYLSQELADATAVLGWTETGQSDLSILWTEDAPGPDRVFQVLPDGGPQPDPNSADPEGWDLARFRFQTSRVAGDSSSLGWFSFFVDNPPTEPPGKSSTYGFSVFMRTNAGGSGWPTQSGVALHALSEIASGQSYGKAEALVVSAKHQQAQGNIANGKLVGVQSVVFPRGSDTGPGNSSGQINSGAFTNYGFSADTDPQSLYAGFCAYMAKSREDPDDPEEEGAGWYNGFVADTDSITARSFWHIGRFAVVPIGLPDDGEPPAFRSAWVGIGNDDPDSSLHVTYNGTVDVRLEDTKTNAVAADIASLQFHGKGVTAGLIKELVRISGRLTTVTANQEDSQFTFRTTTNGSLSVVWNMAGGLWSEGATQGNRGIHTINVGTGGGNDGYYVAGNKVVGAKKTGWTAWTGTANRNSFDANSPSLTVANVAQALKALLDDLIAHGLIGT